MCIALQYERSTQFYLFLFWWLPCWVLSEYWVAVTSATPSPVQPTAYTPSCQATRPTLLTESTGAAEDWEIPWDTMRYYNCQYSDIDEASKLRGLQCALNLLMMLKIQQKSRNMKIRHSLTDFVMFKVICSKYSVAILGLNITLKLITFLRFKNCIISVDVSVLHYVLHFSVRNSTNISKHFTLFAEKNDGTSTSKCLQKCNNSRSASLESFHIQINTNIVKFNRSVSKLDNISKPWNKVGYL